MKTTITTFIILVLGVQVMAQNDDSFSQCPQKHKFIRINPGDYNWHQFDTIIDESLFPLLKVPERDVPTDINDQSATSKTSENNEIKVNIGPNPAINELNIYVNNENSDSQNNTFYNIMNISGQVIISSSLKDVSKKIDISAFPSGGYFVNVIRGNQRVTKMFVK